MRILHIHRDYRPLGGGERYLFDLARALEEKGHEVIVLTSRQKDICQDGGRKVYTIPNAFGFRDGLAVSRVIEGIVGREDPQLIHLHNTHYFLSPPVVHRLQRLRPTVQFFHSLHPFCLFQGRKIIPREEQLCRFPLGVCCLRKGCWSQVKELCFDRRRWRELVIALWGLSVARRLERVLVGSRYMVEELRRNGFPEERISVLPLYPGEDPVVEGEEGTNGDGEILFVGRIHRDKGLWELLDALSLIQGRAWSLKVVGEGERETLARFCERIQELTLENRVSLVGKLSGKELAARYRACALVVFPSIVPETFGLVGVEAMSFARPVVAFDVGGVSEWLVDGETGFLVERRDIRAFAARVAALLDDPALAARLGRQGKERVERCFSRGQHVDRLLGIYQEVIRARARKR